MRVVPSVFVWDGKGQIHLTRNTSEMKYSGHSVYTEPQRAAAVWGFFSSIFCTFLIWLWR